MEVGVGGCPGTDQELVKSVDIHEGPLHTRAALSHPEPAVGGDETGPAAVTTAWQPRDWPWGCECRDPPAGSLVLRTN